MKRIVLLMGLLLSLGMFCACSSDDEIDDVFGKQLPTNNSSNENKGKNLKETWELRSSKGGWGQGTTFNQNDVTCHIYANGIIEVINETDINLSPFANSGSYPFQVYSKDVTTYSPQGEKTRSGSFVSIDGIQFEKEIDKDGILHLYHNSIEHYWADGWKYDFVIIKK